MAQLDQISRLEMDDAANYCGVTDITQQQKLIESSYLEQQGMCLNVERLKVKNHHCQIHRSVFDL